MMSTPTKKKKTKHKVTHGHAYIQSTFNNTIISITDTNGDVISWASAGACGFKGSRKGTPFASQSAALKAGKEAFTTYGLRSVAVYVSGPGAGRESAIRSLQSVGIDIQSIRDITPVPHNGCRAPKKRRV
ncbi:MAG: 30S ribosomal protein S11 [Candidatus Caenarcaniphilales bacterium]|nr:30S ribosomal protein S11 [Candidatus Caenarcaniphilales bacterium]